MNPEVVNSRIVREIAKQVWDSREPHIDLQERCQNLLRKHLPDFNELKICDVLENIEHKVKAHIKKEIAHCREKGVTPRYEFSEVSNILYKARDIRVDETKSKIKSIDWRDFEYLCAHLLEINGIEGADVTRRSREGGIDFYGLLRIHKFNDIEKVLLKGLEIRIIGQAKHHSTAEKVGEPEVNLFAKQFQDFRNGKGRGWKTIPVWFKNLRSPLQPMFITNAETTQDACDLAKDEGIILRDGDQIAEDLADSSELGKWLPTKKG